MASRTPFAPLGARFVTCRFVWMLAACAGCVPDLGPCDPIAAEAIVFLDTGLLASDENGFPMTEGQAMVHLSCGSTTVCHAETATGIARFGVPRGLDFDVDVACLDARCLASDTTTRERLARGQATLRRDAHDVVASVESASMPPGAVGRDVTASRAAYFHVAPVDRARVAAGDVSIHDVGVPVPEPSTPAGRAVLRTWLACGAPVVERVQSPLGQEPGEPCGALSKGPVGLCITRLEVPIVPPQPTWASIYDDYLSVACAPCHTTARTLVDSTGLDLASRDVAYASLVAAPMHGRTCRESGGVRVAPFDSASSRLLEKLAPSPSCGAAMPSARGAPVAVRDAIAAWIDAGAAP